MKKTLIFGLVISLLLGFAGVIIAGQLQPGIRNTPHDVYNMTGDSTLEPCAMCHTPHSGAGDYPIWNRAAAGVVYDMYASPSFDMGEGKQPQSPSSLCLVCHNGVYSTLVNYPGPGSIDNAAYDYEMNPGLWAMLGTDLTNDHPISFTYVPSKDNTQDNNAFPVAIPCPSTPNRMWIPNNQTHTIAYPLYGPNYDQFECATCHAVHDTVSYAGKNFIGGKSVGTQVFFLRKTNAGSSMCADCHVNRLEGNHGF
jgi:hypothetical protein